MSETRAASRLLAVGLLVLVAVLGVLGGIVLDRTVLRSHGPSSARVAHEGLHEALFGPPNREVRSRVREHLVAGIADDLDLSADQRALVADVLERHQARLADAMAETRPRLRRIVEEIHVDIRAILTPEQRERFDDMWVIPHGAPAAERGTP